MDAAQLLELLEDQADGRAGLLIRVQIDFTGRQTHIAQRHADEQLAPPRLVEPPVVQTVPHDVQLHLAHDPFVTCLVNHKLYFSRVRRSESASIAARSAATSPASSTPFGGRMSHGSSCNFPTGNAPRYRRRGPICRRRALP